MVEQARGGPAPARPGILDAPSDAPIAADGERSLGVEQEAPFDSRADRAGVAPAKREQSEM